MTRKRIVQLVVFAIFTIGALVLLYVGATQYLQQRRLLANAVEIQAVIVKSQVASSTSADTDRRLNRDTSTTSHTAEIRFSYVWEGQPYESDMLDPTVIVQGYASHEGAAAELEPYPVGATVPAYLDPQQPDKAFLRRRSSPAPLVFMVLGLLLPIVVWFAVKLI